MTEDSDETLRVRVDREICTGHALCAFKAPRIFTLDDDGACASDGRPLHADEIPAARLGAASCPERAITLVAETNKS